MVGTMSYKTTESCFKSRLCDAFHLRGWDWNLRLMKRSSIQLLPLAPWSHSHLYIKTVSQSDLPKSNNKNHASRRVKSYKSIWTNRKEHCLTQLNASAGPKLNSADSKCHSALVMPLCPDSMGHTSRFWLFSSGCLHSEPLKVQLALSWLSWNSRVEDTCFCHTVHNFTCWYCNSPKNHHR